MNRYLAAIFLVLAWLVMALIVGFTGPGLLIAIPLSLGFFAVGYIVMTRRFLSRCDSRPIPAITRGKDDPGPGHTAVIYFAHGEPETYDPTGWINQFNEFDEQGIPFVPLVARPLFCHQLRRKYLQVGKSDHRSMHARMLGRLEEAYRREGDTKTRFYLSFLDDHPMPDAAAVEALIEGASRIVVAEVFLTISNHTAEGESLLEDLHIEETYGVPVVYTGPLYDSRTLQRMFVH
jgi:hypothetical protein